MIDLQTVGVSSKARVKGGKAAAPIDFTPEK